jgi:hypothetical protein
MIARGMMAPASRRHSDTDLCCEILRYLAASPDAQDTLEGILDWQGLSQTKKQRRIAVKKALAILVSKGLVGEKSVKNSGTCY